MNRLLPPRRLIPRWRMSKYAVLQADMLGLVKPVSARKDFVADISTLTETEYSWKASGSLGDLADLLSHSVNPALREQLVPAARAALAAPEVPLAMKLAAQEILQAGESYKSVWSEIGGDGNTKRLRSLLRQDPRNAIALVDLAQHYLSLGKTKAAYRCLLAAKQLSPLSVYVTRCIARYWIHLENPDKAHHFIKSSPLVGADPWLMATEIAVAEVAGSQSSQLRRAQRAINTQQFSAKNASELAAAIGGAELRGGNLKDARKLFRIALDCPNDNVLAQVIHRQEYLGIAIDEKLVSRVANGAFEVRAFQAFMTGDFDAAASLTASWGEEEPFSSRPRLLESYALGAAGQFEKSLRAAEVGLRTDPADTSLRENKAYALAGLRRLDEAEVELRYIEAKGDAHLVPFSSATRGMIALLRGEHDFGFSLYEMALAEFQKRKDDESLTTCLAFMARTSLEAGAPQSVAVLERARARFLKSPSPAASVILKTLDQQVEFTREDSLRRVVQWEWDPAKNSLIAQKKLTAKGAAPVVVKKAP